MCLLMTLAGNCETNVVRGEWSPNCQPPDVVHSLKSTASWNQGLVKTNHRFGPLLRDHG